MTYGDYFGQWLKVIDSNELNKMVHTLMSMTDKNVYPAFENTFESFYQCKYESLSVVILGQDPYFDGRATGLAFANPADTKKLSPSLDVLKRAVCRYKRVNPEYDRFDPTLLSWAHQGVLLLNTALSVEAGKPGSHTMMWRPFIQKFLQNLGERQTGIIYVLMGAAAMSFRPYIGKYNDIIKCPHPAYCARTGEDFPNIFERIDELTMSKNGFKIKWM